MKVNLPSLPSLPYSMPFVLQDGTLYLGLVKHPTNFKPIQLKIKNKLDYIFDTYLEMGLNPHEHKSPFDFHILYDDVKNTVSCYISKTRTHKHPFTIINSKERMEMMKASIITTPKKQKEIIYKDIDQTDWNMTDREYQDIIAELDMITDYLKIMKSL
jgi:hypothetical protein